ncbi:hypothetical protein D9M68_315400 [compost metagenome]
MAQAPPSTKALAAAPCRLRPMATFAHCRKRLPRANSAVFTQSIQGWARGASGSVSGRQSETWERTMKASRNSRNSEVTTQRNTPRPTLAVLLLSRVGDSCRSPSLQPPGSVLPAFFQNCALMDVSPR